MITWLSELHSGYIGNLTAYLSYGWYPQHILVLLELRLLSLMWIGERSMAHRVLTVFSIQVGYLEIALRVNFLGY